MIRASIFRGDSPDIYHDDPAKVIDIRPADADLIQAKISDRDPNYHQSDELGERVRNSAAIVIYCSREMRGRDRANEPGGDIHIATTDDLEFSHGPGMLGMIAMISFGENDPSHFSHLGDNETCTLQVEEFGLPGVLLVEHVPEDGKNNQG